jgi:hypothetical protein
MKQYTCHHCGEVIETHEPLKMLNQHRAETDGAPYINRLADLLKEFDTAVVEDSRNWD